MSEKISLMGLIAPALTTAIVDAMLSDEILIVDLGRWGLDCLKGYVEYLRANPTLLIDLLRSKGISASIGPKDDKVQLFRGPAYYFHVTSGSSAGTTYAVAAQEYFLSVRPRREN